MNTNMSMGPPPILPHDLGEGTSAGSPPTPGGGQGGSGVKKAEKVPRGARACRECRRQKLRCVDAEDGATPCRRCLKGGHNCIFDEHMRGRGVTRRVEAAPVPIRPKAEPSYGSTGASQSSFSAIPSPQRHQQASPPSHTPYTPNELMVSEASCSDALILPTPPAEPLNPLALLAEASLNNHRKRHYQDSDVLDPEDSEVEAPVKRTRTVGVANALYFQPTTMNARERQRLMSEPAVAPELLTKKIITLTEASELFGLYFEKCHVAWPMLDPHLHTTARTLNRSPFLFTCVCMIASRFYTKRTDNLYKKCLKLAKQSAYDVFAKGYKSVEICQAFLILCIWKQPEERFEQERVYQFSGVAARMGADLNLNRRIKDTLPETASPEVRMSYEREVLNRERAWLCIYIFDRSVASQMGKLHSIPREDPIVRSAKVWHLQPLSQKSDTSVTSSVELHRLLGRILETLYSDTESEDGLSGSLDYSVLMRSFLKQLDQWKEEWTVKNPTEPEDMPDGIRSSLKNFYYSYYRLFLLSYALQHALKKGSEIELPLYCASSFQAAADIVTSMRDRLGPKGYLRYAVDSPLVYLTYACVFLLKLVSPACAVYIDTEKALNLVRDGAAVLEAAAIDETHAVASHAVFIRTLLENRRNGGMSLAGSRSQTRPASPNNYQGDPSAAPQTTYFDASLQHSYPEMGVQGQDIQYDLDSMNASLNEGFWSNMIMTGFPLGSFSSFGGDTWALPSYADVDTSIVNGSEFPYGQF